MGTCVLLRLFSIQDFYYPSMHFVSEKWKNPRISPGTQVEDNVFSKLVSDVTFF